MDIKSGCKSPISPVGFRVGFRAAAALLLLSAALLLSTGTVQAQAPDASYDEAEAQAIDRMLMCPVCPAESIDQAQVPLARQMRQQVRELLAAGHSRGEVLAHFADRYGTDVLASPPKSGLNLLAWILPIAGVLAALVAGGLVIRAMTARPDAPPTAGSTDTGAETDTGADTETDLTPYLAAVDRELDLTDPPDSTESTPLEEK